MMSKKSLSRWVAGFAVLAGIAFGATVGTDADTYRIAEGGDIVWTVGSSVSVLR
jgi:hypothetical protein